MKRKERILRLIPWLILAAAYVLTMGLYARYGACGLDADISSEMVLADLLNEERALITPNWYYSSELRVVSPVPAYQLGLALFPGSWHAARTFGLGLMLLGVALAVVYMGRGAGHEGPAALAAAVLILPVSEVQRFLFSSGGFYTAYVLLSCVLIGLVLRLPRVRRRRVRLALLAVLGFIGGLSGVRMLMICMAPLMIACLLEAFSALRRAQTPGECLRAPQTVMAAGAALGAAAMLAGYLVNTRVLAGFCHFSGYEEVRMSTLDLSGVLTQLRWIAEYLGYRPDVPFMSMRGVCNVLISLACAGMALGLIRAVCALAERTAQERLMTVFAACALALGLYLNVVMNEARNDYGVGYYLTAVFAWVFAAFMMLETMRCRMRGVRTLAMLLLAAVFGLQALVYTANYLPDTPLVYEAAADWLTENGYRAGYSTFWHGNVLTECSDGAIDMYTYDAWTDGEPTPWLQRTDHMDSLPQGRVFACVGADELEDGSLPFAREEPVWSCGGISLYAYESAQALQDALRAVREQPD